MIHYNHDTELLNEIILNPKTCFLMTQLGDPISDEVKEIRSSIHEVLENHGIKLIDASSYVTGRDFLNKIWKLLLSVPLGIAILTKKMPHKTVANIFYEIGVLNTLGKESIIIKTPNFKIPSDFLRTEYIDFDTNFITKFNKFIESYQDLSEHYKTMSETLEANPLLSIDYYRRFYLISGDQKIFDEVERIYKDNNNFDNHSK